MRVLDGLAEFREHLGGTLSITLPKGVGRRVDITSVDPDIIARGVAFLRARSES
jgi:3-dehydroquinate synthase